MTKFQYASLTIPEETVGVAKAAFPKGNVYLKLRDQLGSIFKEEDFAELYSDQGQGGYAPWRLALVTLVQYREGWSDEGVAEQVRARIDLKYLLGLSLSDTGFHYSILSQFRERLLRHQAEQMLLDKVLQEAQQQGLLKAGGRQRSDATHVLARVKALNRLELVGETLRAGLNQIAQVGPEWLIEQARPEWYERYERRFEESRLPHKKGEREQWQEQIGADGQQLLKAIEHSQEYGWLLNLPQVKILQQVWGQQYIAQGQQLRWREQAELGPWSEIIHSPYDVESRTRTKRQTTWSGYSVHLSESCDDQQPHLITDVQTVPATTDDIHLTSPIHQALAAKACLPAEHLVDGAYIEAELILKSRELYNLELVGPVCPDTSWQARAGQGFDLAAFQIDWAHQQVTCPTGQTTDHWSQTHDKKGRDLIRVQFPTATCRCCPERSHCVKSETAPRRIHLRPQAEFELLQASRAAQNSQAFQLRYNKRAGIEGTISQGVRAFGLRRSRFIGLAKTHLQHLATAAAINLSRLFDWWDDDRPYQPHLSPLVKLNPARC